MVRMERDKTKGYCNASLSCCCSVVVVFVGGKFFCLLVLFIVPTLLHAS
jgi:hypothetical protein